jgi:hypothetical protein
MLFCDVRRNADGMRSIDGGLVLITVPFVCFMPPSTLYSPRNQIYNMCNDIFDGSLSEIMTNKLTRLSHPS